MQINSTPTEYILSLFKDGKDKKAYSALEFYLFSDEGLHKSSYYWSKRWKISKSTAWKWCKDFELAADTYYRALLRAQHKVR